jgi:hypothetical protein
MAIGANPLAFDWDGFGFVDGISDGWMLLLKVAAISDLVYYNIYLANY